MQPAEEAHAGLVLNAEWAPGRWNDPEGRSLMRSAFFKWKRDRALAEIEAIGIEQDHPPFTFGNSNG